MWDKIRKITEAEYRERKRLKDGREYWGDDEKERERKGHGVINKRKNTENLGENMRS